MAGRKRWIVSFLAAAALAALVVIAVVSGVGGADACEEWQERYVAAYESFGLAPGEGTGTLQFVNEGPLAGLDQARPDGCPEPR